MAKVYEYILKARDQVSGKLKTIAKASKTVEGGLHSFIKRTKQASHSTMSFGGVIKRVAPMLIGLFGVHQLFVFNNGLMRTTAEFEKYEAVLTNTFQSATMGKSSMQMIENFASKTPFQVDELTDSFVKLVNRGFVPTKKEMTSLGDLASSQGKSFNQFTEALLDAQTGEFERLKEFGIKARKSGDQVAFSFKGQTKTVKFTESAIKDYLVSLGQTQGVAGSMNAISKTTGGMLSNLADKATMLRKKWGGDMKELYQYVIIHLGGAFQWLTKNVSLKAFATKTISFFNKMKPVVKNLGSAFYSVWNAMQPLFGAAKQLGADLFNTNSATQGVSNVFNTLSSVMKSLATPIEIFATGLGVVLKWITPIIKPLAYFTVRIWALNFAMSASPVSMLILGFVALVGAVSYAYNKFAWFRGGILGIWETMKGFATMIKDYVIARFWDMISTVSHVAKALKHLMKGEFADAFSSGKDALKSYIGVDAKKKFLADGKGLGANFNKGYKQGVDEIAKKKGVALFSSQRDKQLAKRKSATNEDSYESMLGLFNNKKTDETTTNGEGSTNAKGLSGITGGGSKQTNITVNLGKFMEHFNINTTNLQEGVQQSEEMLMQMFLRILNSTNQLQTD